MEDKIYLNLINEYGLKLDKERRGRARELFQQYIERYNSVECLYWSLWKLGDRDLIANAGLFLCDSLHSEVSAFIEDNRDEIDISLYNMLDNTFSFGLRMSKQGKEIEKNFDSFFSENTIEELKTAYIKYYLNEQMKFLIRGTYAPGPQKKNINKKGIS